MKTLQCQIWKCSAIPPPYLLLEFFLYCIQENEDLKVIELVGETSIGTYTGTVKWQVMECIHYMCLVVHVHVL